MLSLEVEVWATVFGFPLATPFSFSGFPFPIAGEVSGVEDAKAAHPVPTRTRPMGSSSCRMRREAQLYCALWMVKVSGHGR